MEHRINRGVGRFAAIMLICVLLLAGCGARKDAQPLERPTYENAVLSELVRLDAYEGLEISLPEGTSKSEAVWQTILQRTEILSYPEDAVNYYAEQTRETYRYYAKKHDWSYEETLEKLGVTEEEILEEARGMVKSDLVYRYIVADAKITLTEEDKARLLDRYAEKFANDYGKTVEEVKETMLDLILESMLYDKTMEHLILRNTFVAAGSET